MAVLSGFLLSLIVLVAVVRKAWVAHRYAKLEKQHSGVFEKLIHRHIYQNPDLYQLRIPYIDLPLDEFRHYKLSDRQVRKVLVGVMLRCCEQFPGEKKRLLKKLYKDLDLELYTIIELDLLKGDEYIASLEELKAMEIALDPSRIKPFLRSKNVRVRRATRRYLRSMKGFTSDFALEEHEQSAEAVLA